MKKLLFLLSTVIMGVLTAQAEPLSLDLDDYFAPESIEGGGHSTYDSLRGEQVYDGLPFKVAGYIRLFGKAGSKSQKPTPTGRPAEVSGISVGRRFDEIHILHACAWSDVQGQAIATVRLHYADGSAHELPIGYGVHVRDWQRLVTEEHDEMSDPETKVVWRGEGIKKFNATARLFKSRFHNPHPQKEVVTVDFVSRQQIASYAIFAATVVNSNSSRPVTAEVPIPSPKFVFDGVVTVKVEDTNGNPIDGVWVYPNYTVPDRGWLTVAEPFYTTVEGLGTSRYPQATSNTFSFNARKEGWIPSGQWIDFRNKGEAGAHFVVVIRMERDPNWVEPITLKQSLSEKGSSEKDTEEIPEGSRVGKKEVTTLEIIGEAPLAKPIQNFRPTLILFINFPEGSRVRVESASRLSQREWAEEAVIDSLPFSGYPYTCDFEDCGMDSGYYRAVLIPKDE